MLAQVVEIQIEDVPLTPAIADIALEVRPTETEEIIIKIGAIADLTLSEQLQKKKNGTKTRTESRPP